VRWTPPASSRAPAVYRQLLGLSRCERRSNQLLGAAKLANEIWLHGSGRSAILDVITNGRMNQMPAQEPVLGPDRVHVLAAYVVSLFEAGMKRWMPAAIRSATTARKPTS